MAKWKSLFTAVGGKLSVDVTLTSASKFRMALGRQFVVGVRRDIAEMR